MDNREKAIDFLYKLRSCREKNFFHQLNESQTGIGFVLVYLFEATDEVYAGDLAKALGVSTARVAVLLKKMEKQGLILRIRSEEDARRTVVRITEEGEKTAVEMREAMIEKIELLLEKVGQEELEEFLRLLGKIKESLEIDENCVLTAGNF